MISNILGHPDYHITKDGELYSKKSGKWKLRKAKVVNGTGRVNVQLDGKNYKIHRLVALAYIPNPENKPCVCHKDNNPLNNRVDNLYWGTQAENMSQASRDNRLGVNKKLNPKQRRRIIIRIMKGYPYRQLALRYGVVSSTIHKIASKANLRKDR